MSNITMQGKKFQPIEYKVVVLPDLIEETDDTIKRFKALGMELPEAEKEREMLRQITGTLVAVGGKAFEDFGDPSPKVGDKVYFAKYAGMLLRADDGEEYRLMWDKDITAVLV
jgi:co-chaperonin GroES (HSP10)